MDTISDVESAVRKMSVTEDQGDPPDNGVESQGRMFFGGIWWKSSWGKDLDLYDDHDYWKYDDDAIMEEEDSEEEDPEE